MDRKDDQGQREPRQGQDGVACVAALAQQKNDSEDSRNCGVPVLEQDTPVERMLIGRAVLQRLDRAKVR